MHFNVENTILCSQTCSYCLRFRSNEKKYQVQANVGANVQPFNEEDTPSHPRTQASIKLAVQITYSADEIKAQLGQQTTNAVCQASVQFWTDYGILWLADRHQRHSKMYQLERPSSLKASFYYGNMK
ncbi:unnamed protein product [Heterobilharzia americana]|nr:unnamed protein product [Heterobilharzia americana]